MPALAPVLSVSALNRLARETLERAIPLTWVAGEVSNLTRAASGHVYFSLKDDSAQVRCAMFRNRAQLLPFALANGMQVEVRALVTLYEARGDFQLNVEAVRRAGLGVLFEAFTRLKEKLARDGLFDDARKRALPIFPRRVGVVTSLQAAALHDVLAALMRRAAHVPVTVYPAAVQGDGAAAQLAEAIRCAGARRECDVLILVRGGGSIEDLWAFNDEALARAIAASAVPVVCGVGHEADFTIADFVADRRAATPTAAAELASAGWFAAAGELRVLSHRLQARMNTLLRSRMQSLDLLQRRLVHPAQRLRENAQRLAHLGARLTTAGARRIERAGAQFDRMQLGWSRNAPDVAALTGRLERAGERLRVAWTHAAARRTAALERLADALLHLNPQATLERGYSITYAEDGRIVRDSRSLHPGAQVSIRFAVGSADADVTRVDVQPTDRD